MGAILHLSLPVRNLPDSLRFYVEVLGCPAGRVRDGWTDVWFFGMQVTLQERPDEVLPEVGTRHFGVMVDAASMDELVARLERHGARWLVPPTTEFAGTSSEQRKAKLRDPSGNVIEIKSYVDPGTALSISPQLAFDEESAAFTGPLFVVVSGPPASGKSTLAPLLAQRLHLPLVAKDTIKDALMDVLPVADVAGSRQVGRAAVQAMLAVARASTVGAVIESNFYRSAAAEDLRQLPGEVIEVFCRCDEATAAARYQSRAGTRSAGHFDRLRTNDELWNDEVCEPVAGGWRVIEVDTSVPVDVAELHAQVTATQ